MWKVLVKHQDLTTEKHLTTTTNKDCEYIKGLVKEYKKQGFIVRFEDISRLAHLD